MTLAGCLARGALRLGRIIPSHVAIRIGATVGWAFGYLPGRERRRAREHLARAFPEHDAQWHRRTAHACFRHFGRMVLWMFANAHRAPQAQRRGVAVEGAAHLRAAVRAHSGGAGTVGISGHLGNWELLARLGGSFVPLSVIGRRLRNADLDALIVEQRRGDGTRGGYIHQDEGLRPCLRALRAGHMLATLPDQDVPRLAGVFVPWFGIPAWTPVGPAQLGALTRTALQPIFCFWHGGRWVSHWGPRVMPPAGDRDAAALALTRWTTAYQEVLVRRHPEQWVWWHKRWRTQPGA